MSIHSVSATLVSTLQCITWYDLHKNPWGKYWNIQHLNIHRNRSMSSRMSALFFSWAAVVETGKQPGRWRFTWQITKLLLTRHHFHNCMVNLYCIYCVLAFWVLAFIWRLISPLLAPKEQLCVHFCVVGNSVLEVSFKIVILHCSLITRTTGLAIGEIYKTLCTFWITFSKLINRN